jgi:hypothetical protein
VVKLTTIFPSAGVGNLMNYLLEIVLDGVDEDWLEGL